MRDHKYVIKQLGTIDRMCIELMHEVAALARENESLDVLTSRAETALEVCAEWIAEDSKHALMQITADKIADAAYAEAMRREAASDDTPDTE